VIERALFAAVLLMVGFVLYRLYIRHQIRRAKYNIAYDPLLQNGKRGVPTIIYFTTPTCAPCRLQQTPVLEQLRRELDDDHLRLIRVDATENPEAADRWGVFSVPTLFVLNAQGQPRSVFNGVVGLEKLKQELQVS
jgi:thioredoxin-like negative regulator of GroEL